MKVLLLCDDYWHPGQIPIDGIAPLKQRGFDFDIITNAGDFSSEKLSQYQVVIMCKCDEKSKDDKQPWKTKSVQRAFVNYVEGGGGLLVIHTGTVAGKDTEELDKLIGCRFLGHPKDCPVTVSPIKPHPVTEGVGTFCEVDEHYHLEMLSADADILLASYSAAQGEESKYQEDPYNNCSEAICPCGYVRTQGKGRVCVLTPGHLLPVWLNPQFQRLLENALNWVGGGK